MTVDTAKIKKVTRQSKESRVAAILEASRAEFEDKGYENAKTADIAARVGIVEGTVFHYFKSKRELMVRVMEKFYADITDAQHAGLRGINGIRNQLAYLIHHHLSVMAKNAAICGVITTEIRGVEGDLKDEIQNLNRRYTASVIRVVEQGIHDKEIRQDTPAVLIRNTIYGSIEHALWGHLSEGHPINVEQYASDLLRLIYDGIRCATESLTQQEITTLVRKLDSLMDKSDTKNEGKSHV